LLLLLLLPQEPKLLLALLLHELCVLHSCQAGGQ
jgi:hypothetical protein